jgi:tetratricopeptide (TPR) repeat protein
MAKKQLNRKAALIGSFIAAVVIMLIIGLVLYLSRDPNKFIADGDVTFKTARETSDPDQRKELYGQAERKYRKAYGLSKTDELKVETLYRLAELFKSNGEWRKVLGCWAQIISLDKKDMLARYALLKYLYIAAQNSPGLIWQDVGTQASEFIELIEKPDVNPELATTETSKLEIDELKQKGESTHPLGAYLHLIRGRANFESTRLGLVTNKEESLKQAVADLEKVKQLEPANAEVYLYLAQAAALRGDIEAAKGNLDAGQKGREDALTLLKEGVEATKDNIQANINLLGMKHSFVPTDTEPNLRSRILALEPEYLALVNKFGPSNPEALSALASFYADYHLGPVYLDKSIETIEKAINLDPNNVDYAILATHLRSKRYNIHKQKTDLDKAIATAKKALSLPDAQETTGPRSSVARANQLRLNTLLSLNYLGQILDSTEPSDKPEGQRLLAEVQQSVRQMEQLYASGDDPQVIKWQGIVELAEAKLKNEDPSAATRKLYNIYTQLKASERSDPILSYILARTFANSPESGAVGEFLSNAIENGIEMMYPEARLDYTDLLIKATLWKWAIASVDIFEEQFGVTDRSRILRIRAHIGAREFEQAQRNLEQMPQDDPNRLELTAMMLAARCKQIRTIIERRQERPRTGIVLQKILIEGKPQAEVEQRSTEQLTADIKSSLSAFIEYTDKLHEKDPNLLAAGMVSSLCEDAIVTGQFKQAAAIADKLLKYEPDNAIGLFYKRLLAEDSPAKVSDEKRKLIREEIIMGVTDPIKRTLSLGVFYQMNGEPNKAVEQFEKLAGISGGADALEADEGTRRQAISFLFETALGKKDWATIEKIYQIAKRENLDNCSGDFFAARTAMVKEQYETALASIDRVLNQRPVFAYGHLLRARINTALGKEETALGDIRNAATINPFDKLIAKELANQLYLRNQKLADAVSSAQLTETKNALDWALGLNPEDTELISFYAEYISDSDPERALALRQSLQENAPSMRNALLLARMAIRLALENANAQRKQALFAMAQTALEQAKSIDPQNPSVLESYAEYYRQTGQGEKAEQMLSQQSALLWRHYLRSGQYEEAKKVLEQSYAANPKDPYTIKGLLLVAERANDKEAVKKYLEQLISIEDTLENHLLLVQTYLKIGLVDEAEQKLASFRERYPTEGKGLLLAAWLSMRKGQLKDALELTNKRLESDQSDSTAWYLRGNLNYMLADYDQTIMDLKRSKNLLDMPVTRILLAKTYLRTGRTEDAITELKQMVDDPQTPDDARLLLEQIYKRTNRTEALREFYKTTVEKLPDSTLWHRRAGAFAGTSGDYAAAQQEYEIALRKSEQRGRLDADALSGYLLALMYEKKYDKLFQDAAKYIDGNVASTAYFRMAQAKNDIGDRISAVQYCRKAVEKAASDNELTIYIQNMYNLLGDKEVEEFCREKLTQEPESYTANLAMFTLCRLKGDYNKAVGYIDECLKATTQQEARWAMGMMQKAEMYILTFYKTSDNSSLKEALNTYESLLEKKPNNTYVLNNIAYILAENDQDLDKALEYAKRACDMKPADAGYLDTYALALYKKGLFADAARTSQSAIQQYEAQGTSPPAEVYENLGQALEKLGELSQARAAYEQALDNSGEELDKSTKERIAAAIERIGKPKGNENKELPESK